MKAMKKPLTLIAAVCVCFTLCANASAQSAEDDVKETLLSFYQALNSGDAAGVTNLSLLDAVGDFPRTGGLQAATDGDPGTVEEQIQAFQGTLDAGLNFQVAVHHLEAKVYGSTAVATYYTTGTTTYADGTLLQGTFRATAVWVKDGQAWKVAHFHVSPLQTGE